MNNFNAEKYKQMGRQLRLALDQCRPLLSQGSIADVEHYLQNGEFEIALESLCLAILAEKVVPSAEAKAILLPLGSALAIDNEGVLDATVWRRVLPLLEPGESRG